MHKYKLYSFLLGVTLVFASCIHDSNSDCPEDVRLALVFEYFADGNNNVVSNYIQSSDIFIYDAQGVLHKTVVANRLELEDTKDIYLKPGAYTFVLWGNYGINSATDNTKSLDKALITTPAYLLNEMPATNDRLYFARKEIEVLPGKAPLSEWRQDDNIEFKNAHIGVKVLVRGFDASEEELLVTNLSAYNNFSATIENAKLITYQPKQTPNTIIAPLTGQFYEFNTFRFLNDNSIAFRLIDPQTKSDLVDPILLKDILAQQSLSVEDTQEVTLFLEITFDNSNVSISIKSWDDIETIPSN